MSHPSPRPYRRGPHRRRRYGLELLLGLIVLAAGTGLLVLDQRAPELTGEEAGGVGTAGPGRDGGSASASAEAPQADGSPGTGGGGRGDGGTPGDGRRNRPSGEPSADSAPPTPQGEGSAELPAVMESVEDEVKKADGELEVVPGKSEPAGEGPRMRYIVEFEKGLPGEAADFATAVEQILADGRSWRGEDGVSMQRVDGGDADFRVALAAPQTVDRMCAPLQTMGRVSCTNGGRAIINQNRWVSGVEHFDGDLRTYRIYVINHEVGHALGRGHVSCPGKGEPAPVMQQQTFGLQGCEPNGWVQD
ncbi:DUF3152 domain-containing protein [Streptomonospora wellingtoniae]|uniref:DUF3152 domain-containing protein n=1 Tax=Streptomonospora wellingtoniae TaxID=3075544 RepID=A0ABU2KT06_9ACTN|nr:DUF3152 domain-containing protein [Streptomonospora sp. DSM 45055]MDT0302414.1 DUF3152 domain-containing protein [Streptomonospora sp. DSM 45055]